MFYLYSRRGKLLGIYDNIFLCSEKTGYDVRKLECALENPGLVLGSLFASSYKWKNSKEERERIAKEAFSILNEKSQKRVLEIISKEL